MQYDTEPAPRPVEPRILEAAERRIMARLGTPNVAMEAIRNDPIAKALFDVAARLLAEEMRHG